MNFGERLKYARKLKGLSQEKLGHAAGVTKSSISQIEDGSTKKTSHVVKFSEILFVSPTWLETGEGNISGNNIDLTDLEIELISELRTLNVDDKKTIIKIAKGFNSLTYKQ